MKTPAPATGDAAAGAGAAGGSDRAKGIGGLAVAFFGFLSSGAGMMLLGFALTGLLGPYLNDRLQASLAERERQRTLLEKTISDDLKRINALYDLSYDRYFALQDILTTIKARDAASVETLWTGYRPVVREWNKQLYRNRFVLEAFGGRELAARYLDFGADSESLHFAFRHAHARTLEAKSILAQDPAAPPADCAFTEPDLPRLYRSLEWPGGHVCEEAWRDDLLADAGADGRQRDFCRAVFIADCRFSRVGDLLGPFVESLARNTYDHGFRP